MLTSKWEQVCWQVEGLTQVGCDTSGRLKPSSGRKGEEQAWKVDPECDKRDRVAQKHGQKPSRWKMKYNILLK